MIWVRPLWRNTRFVCFRNEYPNARNVESAIRIYSENIQGKYDKKKIKKKKPLALKFKRETEYIDDNEQRNAICYGVLCFGRINSIDEQEQQTIFYYFDE